MKPAPTLLALLIVLFRATTLFAAGDEIALNVPDAAVVDQNGRSLHFRSDLVGDHLVVVNFVFTSCTTICSPMGANFAALQKRLPHDSDVRLISVSIDPAADTPARLKSWSERFGAKLALSGAEGPGWTLVTGRREEIDRLLKAFGVYTPDRINHSPVLLVGDGRRNLWTRGNGLLAPSKIVELIAAMQARHSAQFASLPADTRHPTPDTAAAGAKHYFGDIVLTDQTGRQLNFYDDLLAGHTVVINSFFATCHGSCPVMAGNFAAIQSRFADRLGKDLVLISITVDPKTDTPQKLAGYAHDLKAKPGWYFLTGPQEDVDHALRKLGQYVPDRNDHLNVFIVGNVQTGLWKKAFGLARADELVKIVQSVLDDHS